jgi:hypothetical protein
MVWDIIDRIHIQSNLTSSITLISFRYSDDPWLLSINHTEHVNFSASDIENCWAVWDSVDHSAISTLLGYSQSLATGKCGDRNSPQVLAERHLGGGLHLEARNFDIFDSTEYPQLRDVASRTLGIVWGMIYEPLPEDESLYLTNHL